MFSINLGWVIFKIKSASNQSELIHVHVLTKYIFEHFSERRNFDVGDQNESYLLQIIIFLTLSIQKQSLGGLVFREILLRKYVG